MVVVIYSRNVLVCIKNIIREREHRRKSSNRRVCLAFSMEEFSLRFSLDRSLEFERNEQMKTKIYEKLNFVHLEINECPLEIEYFRLIYECIESRKIFLNFVDFKVHSNLQRDIDLAILQALLNGKSLSKSYKISLISLSFGLFFSNNKYRNECRTKT